MSVVARLEDTHLMLENHRPEGALLSVLTAISGASRIRYPWRQAMSRENPGQTMHDREAFETFLEDQFTHTRTPRMKVATPAGQWSFSRVIYTLFRCSLAHEAAIARGGEFVPDPRPGVVQLQLTSLDPLGFRISHSTVTLLADLVARAPELDREAAAVRTKIMSTIPKAKD